VLVYLCVLVYNCVDILSCLKDIMHSKQLPSPGELPTHPLHRMTGVNCTTYIIWASSGHDPSCVSRGMLWIAVVYFMVHIQHIPVCVHTYAVVHSCVLVVYCCLIHSLTLELGHCNQANLNRYSRVKYCQCGFIQARRQGGR